MDSRASYVMVGTFFVLISFALIGFIFWLSKYGDESGLKSYYVVMSESVSGLNPQASVKYMGVNVGSVDSMQINPSNTKEVLLLLHVNESVPIKEDTLASLKFYGMTGLAFIELHGGSNKSPTLITCKDKIAYIKSTPSTLVRVDEVLSEISNKLIDSLGKINLLLSSKNIENIDASIENIQSITATLKANMSSIESLIEDGKKFEKDASVTFEDMSEASKNVSKVAKVLEKSIKRGDYSVKDISQNSINKLDELLDELSSLTLNINETVLELKRSPSDILFKKAKRVKGPGE